MLAASNYYDMVTLNGDLSGTNASELADGEWHHVMGVFTNDDVSQNNIYIDGDVLSIVSVQDAQHGTVEIDPDNPWMARRLNMISQREH